MKNEYDLTLYEFLIFEFHFELVTYLQLQTNAQNLKRTLKTFKATYPNKCNKAFFHVLHHIVSEPCRRLVIHQLKSLWKCANGSPD